MIIILDFGSQFSHLISKKIRSLREYTELLPSSTKIEKIKLFHPHGIILSGGPDSVYDKNGIDFDRRIFDIGLPILGICYGYQLLAHLLGGKVIAADKSEYGITDLQIITPHPIFNDLNAKEQVLMSHSDIVINPPIGAYFIAKTSSCSAAFADDKNRIYGLQFHPEVSHTPKGEKILNNFLDMCNSPRLWSLENFINQKIDEIRKINKPVLMAVSGGVDSTVAASLIEKAIPDLLHCVFVDNGLLRLHEKQEIQDIYSQMFKYLHVIDARDEFISALAGISHPETKRKIIGNMFIKVFERTAKALEEQFGSFSYLGQGTIYPDRIESASTSEKASVIKTHHNVGGLPEKMDLLLLEPLSDLYKYEVKEVGRKLAINSAIIERQPFPGPGLAVRCLGEITEEKIDLIRCADDILQNILQKDDRVDYKKLWQVFFVLLSNVHSVGVMGDNRTYEHPGVIRVVKSNDAMTATVPELPFDLLLKVANEIINKVKGINRVCLDLTSKPPGTIEWE